MMDICIKNLLYKLSFFIAGCCLFIMNPELRFKKVVLAASLFVGFTTGFIAPSFAAETSEAEDRLFAAVFDDPANLMLNFKLAGAQLENDNIKGAIGTLERILILSPENNQAQFLLGTANLRLGNTTEARRMLMLLLENPKATPTEREQAQAIIDNLNSISKRFTISGVFTFGGGVADNPEGGSVSNLAESGGSVISGFSKEANHEEFATASANVNLAMKLESQRSESLNFGLSTSTKDFSQYNAGDLSTLGVNMRYSRAFEKGMLNTMLNVNRIHIDDKHYMNGYNATVSYSQTLFDRWNGNIAVAAGRNIFKDDHSSNASEKTAKSGSVNLRLARAYKDFQLGGKLGYSTSRATVKSYSRNTQSTGVFATTNFFPGITTVTYDISHTDYSAADADYNTDEKRKDRTHTLGVNYLIGLSSRNIPVGNEARVSVASKYGKSKSNIANFTKYSGEISLTFIKPF